MCPRVKVLRKVLNPPVIKGFKPYGNKSENKNQESISLLYEEYEALRLSDYDGLNHLQSSKAMDVSRPTFTRIYGSALKKIAKAFIEGRQIVIDGGKIYFDSNWYLCNNCDCYFNNPEKETKITSCPLCGSSQIEEYELSQKKHKESLNSIEYCICPECGFEMKHQTGIKCKKNHCPECGELMTKQKCISNSN